MVSSDPARIKSHNDGCFCSELRRPPEEHGTFQLVRGRGWSGQARWSEVGDARAPSCKSGRGRGDKIVQLELLVGLRRRRDDDDDKGDCGSPAIDGPRASGRCCRDTTP